MFGKGPILISDFWNSTHVLRVKVIFIIYIYLILLLLLLLLIYLTLTFRNLQKVNLRQRSKNR